jgi:hypothetical protein
MKSSSQPIYSIELFIVFSHETDAQNRGLPKGDSASLGESFIFDFTITAISKPIPTAEHAIQIYKINGKDVSSSAVAKTIDLSKKRNCKILYSIEYNGVSYFPEKNIYYLFPTTDKSPTNESMVVSINDPNGVEPIKDIYLLPLDDSTPFMNIDGTFEYLFRVASGQQRIVVLCQINNEYKWLIDANKTTYSIHTVKIFREMEIIGCQENE